MTLTLSVRVRSVPVKASLSAVNADLDGILRLDLNANAAGYTRFSRA
ncbi:hypothetical protein [Pseudomonas aeruginosa]|nr:hypothetical protein [Pseudomonas aeruginosa]MCC0128313.1 hypothetical protein [Pseudomonas aeruginosa]MCC0152455.1 hypothetical protein [Pseudomonas aeruginosa]MCC0159016.1 hypothetical protein [Pseudomonas aeruginosa]MCC0171768.1 hypothetical protein [Pseudomonas aeruginosa]MCC0198102.1 hypothetical protein [Pseudomonas aeruginosa]